MTSGVPAKTQRSGFRGREEAQRSERAFAFTRERGIRSLCRRARQGLENAVSVAAGGSAGNHTIGCANQQGSSVRNTWVGCFVFPSVPPSQKRGAQRGRWASSSPKQSATIPELSVPVSSPKRKRVFCFPAKAAGTNSETIRAAGTGSPPVASLSGNKNSEKEKTS